jgi:hypothetical protein
MTISTGTNTTSIIVEGRTRLQGGYMRASRRIPDFDSIIPQANEIHSSTDTFGIGFLLNKLTNIC